MTINDVYVLIQYIINKNQDGYLSPDEFNLIINQAQTSFLNYLLGEFQQYQVQHPQPRLAYSQNQTTRQRLEPFIKETTLTLDSGGFANYPVDYEQVDAMLSLYNLNRIRFIQQDSQFSYRRSVIDPIETNPVFLLKRGGFQFYPTDVTDVNLSYVSTPQAMFWANINNQYGIPVWDQANSVDPAWFDVDTYEIICRALRMVGVNLQQPDVQAYANDIIKQGQ